MPTNLKSLLSRSRSKNELKSTPAPASAPTSAAVTPAEQQLSVESATATATLPEKENQAQLDIKSQPQSLSGAKSSQSQDSVPPAVSVMRRDLSTKSLHSTFGSTVTTTTTTATVGSTIIQSQSPTKLSVGERAPMPGAGLRKSETMLALTELSGKTGAVRDKIFSASTQTLSSLFSASTTKLFSGFKGIGMGNRASSRSQQLASIEDNLQQEQGRVTPASVAPLTPVNRLRKNWSATTTTAGGLGFSNSGSMTSLNSLLLTATGCPCCRGNAELVPCRLCLSSVKPHETVQLQKCSCRYCRECLAEYCAFEIQEGAYEIACPDASCPASGILTLKEVDALVSEPLLEKFKRFRLARDVEMDAYLCWCPVPGCETICHIEQVCDSPLKSRSRSGGGSPARVVALRVQCPECSTVTCGRCKRAFHHSQEPSCDAWKRRLIKEGKLSPDEDEDVLYGQGQGGLDSIKQCPHCHVPIEKDSGCAQMMCKRCKHVFCWYCLQSLDDDFLLRHYDRGPCKNKLGHSRASIIWHRAQVIGIFAGFGILVVLASPLLILAAPCLLCCRCRYCSTKDGDGSAEVTLTSSSTASQFQHATII